MKDESWTTLARPNNGHTYRLTVALCRDSGPRSQGSSPTQCGYRKGHSNRWCPGRELCRGHLCQDSSLLSSGSRNQMGPWCRLRAEGWPAPSWSSCTEVSLQYSDWPPGKKPPQVTAKASWWICKEVRGQEVRHRKFTESWDGTVFTEFPSPCSDNPPPRSGSKDFTLDRERWGGCSVSSIIRVWLVPTLCPAVLFSHMHTLSNTHMLELHLNKTGPENSSLALLVLNHLIWTQDHKWKWASFATKAF